MRRAVPRFGDSGIAPVAEWLGCPRRQGDRPEDGLNVTDGAESYFRTSAWVALRQGVCVDVAAVNAACSERRAKFAVT